ncbi:Retrovirus-related Pol polyprotein from transposon TNT 1-94 [Senna tora]|uniref:Retrovirus-related Pol polyprotein from transposon TNT 1-94 n=1 Tax=Senna tora TaxID=362788 RepID=A0A834XE28_9FABA|nr:Retrovirus-related Pol polyprotein from transposon TNT 1-94 [Senna tora]
MEEEQSSINKETRSEKQASVELNDRKDPYYIHPSDNPGACLVTNLLNEKNYLVWSRSMWIALKAKNKLKLIDPACEPPEDVSSDEYVRWSNADSLVVGWITQAMTKDLSEAYIFTPTARDLWRDLKEKYGKADRPQIFNLRKKMNTIEQGNDSLATYSNNLKRILDQICCLRPPHKCSCCTCGAFKKIEQERSDDTVMTFVMGLNEGFENVVSNLLMMEPFPAYNRAYSIVSRIEKQKKISVNNTNASVEASALVAKYIDLQKNNNTGGSNKNTFRKKEKGDRHCNHCNRDGHTEDACFKKHGYPDWFKGYKEKKNITDFIKKEMQKYNKDSNDKIVAETPVNNTGYFADFAGMALTTRTGASWIIDSGASSHICGDKRLLTDLRAKEGKNTVTLPDGSVKIVQYIGKVFLSSKLILEDVLFVPEFKYNLISVGKLTNSTGMQMIFSKSYCMVQDLLSKQNTVIGRLKGNLYMLDDGVADFVNHFVCTVDDSKIVNWHSKLGHPAYEALKHLPFDVSLSDVKQWPFSKPSLSGAQYFLTIVDDKSRSVWIYMMQNKSQTTNLLSNFILYVKTQFNVDVKVIRTDNGSEFLSHATQNLFKEKGIVHQKSCVYTPQQNGVVERKHRHVVQVARALLFHAGLSTKFWGEEVLTAAYLINRTPSFVLSWSTPFEVLNGQSLMQGLVNAFFWGYVAGYKGYKVYDLEEKISFVSRDVVFYENTFPLKGTFSDSESVLFPVPVIDNFEDDVVPVEPRIDASNGDPVISQNSGADNSTTEVDSSSINNRGNESDQEISADSTTSVNSQNQMVPRRSERVRRQPEWFKNYVTCTIPSSSSHTPNAYLLLLLLFFLIPT